LYFQAEDGIRGDLGTGVQTCALPIWSERSVALAPDGRSRTEQQHVASRERKNFELIDARFRELGDDSLIELFQPYFDAFFTHTRSEERRVGKECRARMSTHA